MLIFKKLGGLMQKVFLDTSYYIGFGLNFNNQSFSQLIRLAEEGHIQILTSGIILEELKNNIIDSKNKALQALKIIEKEYMIKNNISNIEKLKNDIKNIEETVFNKLKACHLKDINIKEIDVQSIMNDYFAGNPPFAEKENKKSEFPDAIVLHSLLKYLNGEICYIISEDNDWMAFCKEHNSQLIHYKYLSAFINKYIIDEFPDNLLFNNLQEEIFNNLEFIKPCVQETFKFQEFFHDESIIAEPNINLEKIHNITPEDLFIIFFDEENKTIEVELYVTIDFSVKINGYDATSWHKDNETKEIFYIDGLDNKEILVDESTEKRLNLTIVYDEELNFDIENCVMDSEIVTVGLNDYFC